MNEAILDLQREDDRFSSDAALSYTLTSEHYTDPDLHALERERVFARNWSLVCHQSEIANPGDFRRHRVAEEELFVIRGRDGVVRGFYNVCRHRASQLIDEAAGNKRAFITCPYHSWAYDHEGKLRAAHNCENVAGFDKADFSLAGVAVEVFLGFVFVNLDTQARPLAERFGDLSAWMLRECPGIDDYRLLYQADNEVPCNWKLLVENLIESYHLELSGPAHKTFVEVVACDEDAGGEAPYAAVTHDGWSSHAGPAGAPENAAYAWSSPRTLGATNAFATFHVFPDWAFLLWPGANALTVFINSPAGPETTAQRFAYYGPEGEPDEATRGMMHYFSHVLGPEDNELCSRVQKGLRSRSYRQGRLMVDAARSAVSEHPVHHFQAQIRDAMGL